jgi:hypothetical protein
MPDDAIVAVALLTSSDLELLGPTFDRAWPVEDTSCFSKLLAAIDATDREMTPHLNHKRHAQPQNGKAAD